MCVGRDRQNAKRESRKKRKWQRYYLALSRVVSLVGLGWSQSVTRRHRAKLPSAWKGRLLRNGGPRNVPEVLRLLLRRRPRWQQPSSVRAAHRVSGLS
jgi:hypothetical protein